MEAPFFFFLLLLVSSSPSTARLSAYGVNTEVRALIEIKNLLEDPHGVLKSWDQNSVDPCSWALITCSPDSLVTTLEAPGQHLSGLLAPSIGDLTNLETILLQNNNISGPIPAEIGKLANLKRLDLSSNQFHGEIPCSVGHLKSLQYFLLCLALHLVIQRFVLQQPEWSDTGIIGKKIQRSGESPHLRARLLQDGADGDVPLDQEDFTVPSVLQMLLTERANGERRL
ncbi:Os06g0274300 [Oryza sativa Japonica Group]|uniref:Os06g0274300 protein n=1 Tax=Oryza sativa subsp. japonica TaxID=39947 RepID=Q0DCY4_ORYSJ|nr:Os06g0274300 [Oryza sativa Japonica Group]|eukprot:NP_001057375.2 Os06g0274300 [Oryza sativa Japonica Group]